MSILAAAVPADYEAPGVSDFWQPLIGSGSTAITRACFVAVISVALIAWFWSKKLPPCRPNTT